MSTSSRKEKFRKWYGEVVDKLGYRFAKDQELVEFLLEQEVQIEKKYGSPYCPCQAVTGNRDRDMKIVCPCIPFHREKFDKMRRCWCGLFVRKDVPEHEESSLQQIP